MDENALKESVRGLRKNLEGLIGHVSAEIMDLGGQAKAVFERNIGGPGFPPVVDEYDPETCITAFELRSMGMHVQETIPDCAWVPRSALEFDAAVTEVDDTGCGFTLSTRVGVTQPFRWVEFNATLKAAE